MQPLRRLLRRIVRSRCGCQAAEPTVSESTVSAPTVDEDAAEKDLDKRFDLLQFSYREVLDATKHQDDKINRLLTTVAFLTAASLALAGLLSGNAVTAVYSVDQDMRLPLGVIALAGFLGGITMSVIMLISSLTTPLVFPGGSVSNLPEIPYVPYGKPIKFGQIYFYEIAKTSPPEWYTKWADDTPATALKRERNASLVRETHNLAVRTDYKYQRSNEAVAVLSFAMLSFILAAILILIASQHRNVASVDLNWTARAILATIFFFYCWLQLVFSQRGTPPTVFTRTFPSASPGPLPKLCRLIYPALAAGGLPALLLATSLPYPYRLLVPCALTYTAWLAFCEALPWPSERGRQKEREMATRLLGNTAAGLPPPPADKRIAEIEARLRRTALRAGLIAAMYLGIDLLAALWVSHREVIGLAGAYAAGIVLLVSSFWQVAGKPREQVKEFERRVLASEAIPSLPAG
jgi:uncharacterized integral membrane protein